MRRFRDKDFVETPESFLFCVVGSVHPSDRLIAYLKYIPDKTGRWKKKSQNFRRILQYYDISDLLLTFDFLKSYEHYLSWLEEMKITMSTVPLDMVTVHYKPEEKMNQILQTKKLDRLQQKCVNLTKILSRKSGVSIKNFGVTGSILLGIHQDFSDIDLVLYGKREISRIRNIMIQLYKQPKYGILPLNKESREDWLRDKVERFPLSYLEAQRILKRKWNKGTFEGTAFSLNPVKLEKDISEHYGEKIFIPKGMNKVTARIIDASDGCFLPSIYEVDNVVTIEGVPVNDICEVLSYEGFYGNIADIGDRVLVFGKLEHVIDLKRGKKYHRILIGSGEAGGEDYIKPID